MTKETKERSVSIERKRDHQSKEKKERSISRDRRRNRYHLKERSEERRSRDRSLSRNRRTKDRKSESPEVPRIRSRSKERKSEKCQTDTVNRKEKRRNLSVSSPELTPKVSRNRRSRSKETKKTKSPSEERRLFRKREEKSLSNERFSKKRMDKRESSTPSPRREEIERIKIKPLLDIEEDVNERNRLPKKYSLVPEDSPKDEISTELALKRALALLNSARGGKHVNTVYDVNYHLDKNRRSISPKTKSRRDKSVSLSPKRSSVVCDQKDGHKDKKNQDSKRSATPDKREIWKQSSIANSKTNNNFKKSISPEVVKEKPKSRNTDRYAKSKKPLPVVRLRASSSEGEISGKESDKEEDVDDDKDMRMLRLLKSGLAAKAKETLERKKEKPPSPKPIVKRHIEPDLFDIKILPLKNDKEKLTKSSDNDEFDIGRLPSTSKSRSRSKSVTSKTRKSKSKSKSRSRSSSRSSAR